MFVNALQLGGVPIQALIERSKHSMEKNLCRCCKLIYGLYSTRFTNYPRIAFDAESDVSLFPLVPRAHFSSKMSVLSFLQQTWASATADEERNFFFISMSWSTTGVFWLSNLFFFILDRSGIFAKYKVRRTKT
jgi:hypothetical protein